MTKIPQSAALLKTQAATPDIEGGEGRMDTVTATTLRELCDRLDEPFDAELTQRQARQRIAVLRDRDELNQS